MNNTDDNKTGFLVQGGILAFASILVRLIGLIYRIPLTRILGDAGMSFYSTAFEVYNIALLLSSYSLPLAVSKLIATRLARGESRNVKSVFRCALIFAISAGTIISTIIYFGAHYISSHLMNTYLSYIALKVLAPGLLIVAVLGVLRGYFQGYGTMVPTAISQIIEQILNAIVSIVAATYLYSYGKEVARIANVENKKLLPNAYGAAGGTLGTVTGAMLALVFLVVAIIVFNKRYKTGKSKLVINAKIQSNNKEKIESRKQIFKILFMTIVPIILSSVIYNICNIMDQAIFNHTMDLQGVEYEQYAKMLGIYTGKFLLLVNLPLAIANALGASSVPSISTSLVKGRIEDIKSKIALTIRFAMLVAIPCFAGYLFMASPILKLLFNDTKLLSSFILMSGSIMVVFYGMSTVTNAILQGLDKMTYPIKNALISLGIHLVFLFTFLYLFKMGIYSVVIANCIFSLSMCILNHRDIRKICGYKQEIAKTFALPYLCSLVMGLITRLVYEGLSLALNSNISTVISLLVAVLVYIVMIIKTKTITKEELSKMPKGNLIVKILTNTKLLK